MKWSEAFQAMKDGKHIRHKGWRDGISWYMNGEDIFCQSPYIAPDIYQHYPVGKQDVRWAKVAKWELV